MSQLHFPIEVRPEDVARERTFGASLTLCAKLAGYDLDKELQVELGADKAQFSRWKNDKEGIHYTKLVHLMDYCGNDAPLLWMLDQRGYDIASLRKKESEIEKQLRAERERADKAEQEIETLRKFVGALK